jgi:hypothetical protein
MDTKTKVKERPPRSYELGTNPQKHLLTSSEVEMKQTMKMNDIPVSRLTRINKQPVAPPNNEDLPATMNLLQDLKAACHQVQQGHPLNRLRQVAAQHQTCQHLQAIIHCCQVPPAQQHLANTRYQRHNLSEVPKGNKDHQAHLVLEVPQAMRAHPVLQAHLAQ